MKVIGICGGSGSGKSTVSEFFLKEGIPVIDADAIYAELTSKSGECMDALISEFGDSIQNPDGSLNRSELSRIVFFSNCADELRAKLNKISHAFVLKMIEDEISHYGSLGVRAVAVDIPLMFECGFDRRCDVKVAVIADREKRIARIIGRDGIGRETAEKRIDSQLTDTFLIKHADYVVYNNSDQTGLYREVSRLLVCLGLSSEKPND